MTILEKLNLDMKDAMKVKDSFSLSVIRMAKGAIQLEKINKKRDLSEDEEALIISKQIKLRKDSISEFEKANRTDLLEKYQNEIKILEKYMPEQLTEEEIINIINTAFDLLQPKSVKDIGIIMKEISPKVKGKADMGYIKNLIQTKLEHFDS